jgi:hypothetical protein
MTGADSLLELLIFNLLPRWMLIMLIMFPDIAFFVPRQAH